MFRVHSLKNDSFTINDLKLQQAHRLARTVFEPEVPESEYETTPPEHRNLDLKVWRERLEWEFADVLYVVRNTGGEITKGRDHSTNNNEVEPEVRTTTSNEPILGFFLNHPRSKDKLESYHIFISAVHPPARGQGVFSILLDATREYARSMGFGVLTVSTVPGKFERMFRILRRRGSGWEVVKWEGGEGGEGGDRKVVMKMVI